MSGATTLREPLLRRAAPEDLAAVERLLADSDLPLDGVRDTFARFVVADSSGEIVGVAGLEVCGNDALLRSVAVHSAWRSYGVGRALVTRLISDAEARGVRVLYLLTTTAEGYFASFGFRVATREQAPRDVHETYEFTGACPASATLTRRECGADCP